MYHADTLKDKIRLFLAILWPILITQISLSAMNLIDTMMSGRAGTDDLAGVAIGSSLWMPIFTGANGIFLAIVPIIAHFMGADEKHKIHNTITQGIYLAVIVGLIIIAIGAFALQPILNMMALEDNVRHIAYHYLVGLSIGIVPLFVNNVIRNFFDGQGFTRISMIIMVLALPFNALLNYAFIFGHFGLPRMGGIGAGYATGITFWIILAISLVMTFKLDQVKIYRLFIRWVKPSFAAWKEQLSIGIPIGLAIFFETSIFAIVTLMIGNMFTTVDVAANQTVFSFISLTFMVPLSLSMAITIVVGYSVGGSRLDSAKQYSYIGVLGAVGFLVVVSITLILFRENIASMYTTDPMVIQTAAHLFIFAIIFQLSDALQASLQGVLRGYKDVKISFYIAFIAYWLLGIPTGYLFAKYTTMGPGGLWIGITLGLTAAAIGFFIRLQIVYRKKAAEVQ